MEVESSRKLTRRRNASGLTARLVSLSIFFILISPLRSETPSTTVEKPVSAIETTQPAKAADPAPPLYEKPAQTVDYRLLIGSAVGGLIFSFFYLGIKFSRFRGLRIFRNWWAAIWLSAATLLSVITATGGQLGFHSSGVTSSLSAVPGFNFNLLWLLQMIAYPLGGGLLLPILSRLTPKSRSVAQQQVRDFQDLRINGYILERISDNVFDQIVVEIDLIIENYDWPILQRVVRRVIATQLAMGSRAISRETAEGLTRQLEQIQPDPEHPGTDSDNKYRFLAEAIQVLPFCRIRSMLRKSPPKQ
jgi:hypothetical protein